MCHANVFFQRFGCGNYQGSIRKIQGSKLCWCFSAFDKHCFYWSCFNVCPIHRRWVSLSGNDLVVLCLKTSCFNNCLALPKVMEPLLQIFVCIKSQLFCNFLGLMLTLSSYALNSSVLGGMGPTGLHEQFFQLKMKFCS